MSEYQYYEFQAIDRPLSPEVQKKLRQITSRARITSTSLINEYQWGSFKGNSRKLVEDHFDAFVYHANWGTRRFLFRVPRETVDAETLERYQNSGAVEVSYTRTHAIVDFCMDFDGGDGYFEIDEDGYDISPMASLLPLRQSLMSGDMRPMYLAWLAGCQSETEESVDEIEEPPVPPGLNELTPAMESLSNFLCVDQHLFEAAASASSPLKPKVKESLLKAWIASIPETEKNSILLRCCKEEGFQPGVLLQTRFRTDASKTRGGTSDHAAASRRSVKQLLADGRQLADEEENRRQARRQREAEQEAQEKAQARERILNALAGQEERLWKDVEYSVSTRQPKQYDKAIETLRDLFDLARRGDCIRETRARLAALCEKHVRKENFVRKVKEANLPDRY